ncbi:hypothetical protein L0636_11750 [Halomonas janggokensis]|uniref:Uncharacterized protein n=1 Tax=Vreelandella janggokensis TaxID=370767 RepID=A0ABT4ISN4_9GAMM|nr:hypothetical protein [Halomonas janggokensis]MCZ0926029.1 hypothetical protein [Halomonas janggokensis]MCZ0931096.1 hypothetical protein [Halomonas janggokensis]
MLTDTKLRNHCCWVRSQLFELSRRYGVPMAEVTASIEQTFDNAIKNGIAVETEKKSNTGLLLLGAAAIAALVIANR